jgi:preprotein translocase subunit SecE
MGLTRYIHLAFAITGLLAWYVLSEFTTLLCYALMEDVPSYVGLGLGTLVALPIAAVGTIIAWRNPNVWQWANDVAQELKRVTWPGRDETKTSTIVVIVMTIIVSIFLGIFDLIWGSLTDLLQ